MGIFEDLYIKASKAVSKIGEKTNKILNISKYKIEIAEKKNSVSEKYKLIGKYVYDMYKSEDKFEIDDVMDWISEIDKLKSCINKCEEQISKVQEKELCSYCKSQNDAGSKFCSNCGRSISKFDNNTDKPSVDE